MKPGQFRELWKEVEAAAVPLFGDPSLSSDSIVGSCNCLTKSPDHTFHRPGCKYRLICERDEARRVAEEACKFVSGNKFSGFSLDLPWAKKEPETRLTFLPSPEVSAFLDQVADAAENPPGALSGLLGEDSGVAARAHKYPPEVQQHLVDLYAAHGSNLTDEQKIAVLDGVAGAKSNFSTNPGCSDASTKRMHRAVAEQEYLENIGAIPCNLC